MWKEGAGQRSRLALPPPSPPPDPPVLLPGQRYSRHTWRSFCPSAVLFVQAEALPPSIFEFPPSHPLLRRDKLARQGGHLSSLPPCRPPKFSTNCCRLYRCPGSNSGFSLGPPPVPGQKMYGLFAVLGLTFFAHATSVPIFETRLRRSAAFLDHISILI